MSDFDTRPKGTVMYGAFDAFAAAERALRVLKNAGYARAAFEHADEGETTEPSEPTVVVVDAAKTGAARAAEILEEFGAHISSEPPRATATATPLNQSPEQTVFAEHVYAEQSIVPEQTATLAPEQPAPITAPLHLTSSLERKPRVRKRRLVDVPGANAVQVASEPPIGENVIIVTRAIESFASDA